MSTDESPREEKEPWAYVLPCHVSWAALGKARFLSGPCVFASPPPSWGSLGGLDTGLLALIMHSRLSSWQDGAVFFSPLSLSTGRGIKCGVPDPLVS